MIRCYQVTILLCARNRSLTTSSARNPHNFGLQAYVAISVFGEVNIKNCASTMSPQLQVLPNLSSLCQRNVQAHASPGPLDYLSVKGCNQSGMPCVGSSSIVSSSLFTEPRFPEVSRISLRRPLRCLAYDFESSPGLMFFLFTGRT